MKYLKRFLIVFLQVLFFKSSFAACPFEGQFLFDLLKHQLLIDNLPADFPENLFNFFEKELGHFSKKNCYNAVFAIRIKDKSQNIYTAFYTNEDVCDGGNSYGVVVRGIAPAPQNAIAFIRDSEFICSASGNGASIRKELLNTHSMSSR